MLITFVSVTLMYSMDCIRLCASEDQCCVNGV